MKISRIEVQNYQALTGVRVAPTTPIVMFAAVNEQGKTSLIDALRHALTGEFSRVTLKKDVGQLLRDGADGGFVEIEVEGEPLSRVTLPSGTVEAVARAPAIDRALPFLLAPQRIAALEPTALRALLFALSGLSASVDAVREKLLARGHAVERVDEIAPLLRSGFAPAHALAESRVKDARAAWKALTGEVYGSVKAQAWRAPAPEVDAAKIQKADADEASALASLQKVQAEIAQLRRHVQAWTDLSARVATTKEKASTLDARQSAHEQAVAKTAEQRAKVEALQAQSKGYHDRGHRTPCPACGVILAVTTEPKLALVEAKSPSLATSDAVDQLPAAQALLQQYVSTEAAAKRALDEANAAALVVQQLLAEQAALGEQPDPKAIEALLVRETEIIDLRRSLRAESDGLRVALGQKEGADKRTTDAMAAHTDLQAWDKLTAALSPNGIPGEMLTQALTAFNVSLRQQAELSGFAQVNVTPDMAVRIDGRAYGLCSESARWRADAQLAAAISSLSGARFFALDRLDVLDLAEQRLRALVWLHRLAETGQIDTVIVTGTMKSLPTQVPPTFSCFWLQGGEIAAPQALAA